MAALDLLALNSVFLDATIAAPRIAMAGLLGLMIGTDVTRRVVGAQGLAAAAVAAFAAAVALISQSALSGAALTPGTLAESGLALLAWMAIGTIIYTRRSLSALSVAATFWVAVSLGLTAGAGAYAIGFVVAPLGLILLATLRWLAAGELEAQARERGEPTNGLIPAMRPAIAKSADRSVRTWWNR